MNNCSSVTALDLALQAKASEQEVGGKKRKLPSSSGGQVDCSSDEESADEDNVARYYFQTVFHNMQTNEHSFSPSVILFISFIHYLPLHCV